MKIAIVVGGRFHADRMAAALSKVGHEVHLFTTLPRERFPQHPSIHVHPYVPLEVMHRVCNKLGFDNFGDLAKIRLFTSSVSRKLKRIKPDLIIAWSSFGLPNFLSNSNSKKIIVRDSAHIKVQMEVFAPEFKKWGAHFPNRTFCVERELQEYRLADEILVCSDFIRDTFMSEGVSSEKIKKIKLAVDLSVFKPKTDYSTGGPLRVVYFGGLTIYKGVYYLLKATEKFDRSKVDVTLIGHLDHQFAPLLSQFHHATVLPPMNHAKLAEFIRTQDLFVMPSLQDGFGQTVPQAMAAGLPCLVSANSGSKELIEPGKSGFVIPIADANAIEEKIQWFLENPAQIEQMGKHAARSVASWSWEDYGKAVVQMVNELSS